jgi:hypothetical protein
MFGIKFKGKYLGFQVLFSEDRLTQSVIFKLLFNSNQTLLPNANLFLMTCSISVQIYTNYGGLQVFVSRVQTELIDSVYKQEI